MNSQLGKQLHKFISSGDVNAVDDFLRQNYNLNVDERDQDGQSFLMIACRLKHVEIVMRLLEDLSVEDVNAVDNDDWSSLLNAAMSGSAEVVRSLLDAGAAIEHRDMAGWTALMWASYKGWTDVAEVLLQRNANPNVKGEHHMSCLTWAAGRGHTDVVCSLVKFGAKVNTADKYGTTPLIWAARKGHHDIVFHLLNSGAVVDKAGMNSWTALIVASKGGFASVVRLLLDHHPNVNAIDKDGFTALGMAAKEGFFEIVNMLLQKGAYGNLTDREGDTVLIHAVKNNHVEVVKLLLRKYADVDVQGVDNKTALYWAVEKGHFLLGKLLLEHSANMELTNKDGDTPLLRAVRNRNLEIIQLLVDKGAKVSAVDKRGDNCLHVSVRGRSRRITEALLRNPKNSKLLYHKNKKGETAYGIDAAHDRSLLTQVFGAKNLNADDNLQGYELYSATIADVLSEPSLRTPITVGLFARWGSGKSSMIKRLREEMEAYTDVGGIQKFNFGFLHFLTSFLLSFAVGFVLGIAVMWPVGLIVGGFLFVAQLFFYGLVWFGSSRRGWVAAIGIGSYLARQSQFMMLLTKLVFCNVPEQRNRDTSSIRFIFTENARLNTIMGEKSIISIIGTLCDALESKYGIIATRLYKIFKPKKAVDHGKYKSLCCLPHFLILLFVVVDVLVACSLLYAFGFDAKFSTQKSVLTNSLVIIFAVIAAISIVINFYTAYKVAVGLVVPTRKQIQKISSKSISEINKLDSVVPILKKEVDLIGLMVRTMDAFTDNHTRMVVVVDGLDSCEQDKLLNVLDLVHILFGDTNSPFVTILAVDPHIIIKGIEHNINSQFRDTSINGHDYLRNIVQLPFFIQSQCLPKPMLKNFTKYDMTQQSLDTHAVAFNCHRQESQISGASYLSLTDVGKAKQGRRRKLSSNPLSNSTTLLRQPSIYDLSKSLGKASYFSDVNPRNMKRLMNILAVTGRLLRAFNIEFNWYKLASWINLTEQWPYRLSWIILEIEDNESIDDQQSIKFVYDRVSPRIPSSRDVDPLVEIDRNVRKLEVFLSNTSPSLTVSDVKRFLPCTINIDPYLRKLIRELQQNSENVMMGEMCGMNRSHDYHTLGISWPRNQFGISRKWNHSGSHGHVVPPLVVGQPFPPGLYMPQLYSNKLESLSTNQPTHPITMKGELPKKALSQLSTEEICCLIERVDGISCHMVEDYVAQLRSNNINGLVLCNCDVKELKSTLKMKFGDWELFRCLVETLRNESNVVLSAEFKKPDSRIAPKDASFPKRESPAAKHKPSLMPTIPGSLDVPTKENLNPDPDDKSKCINATAGDRTDAIGKTRDAEFETSKSKHEPHHQLVRQDSFVNEVMMETEALINIVEATGVDSESDGSSDGGLVDSAAELPRSGISPIPEEEVLDTNHIVSSQTSLPRHPQLSRQASQEGEEGEVGDRVFFVGPDNDSGESDSEEVERLTHKNSAARKQSSQLRHFDSIDQKIEMTTKRGKMRGESIMKVSTDSTVPLLDLHISPPEEPLISNCLGDQVSFRPIAPGTSFTHPSSNVAARTQSFDLKGEDNPTQELRTEFSIGRMDDDTRDHFV